MGKALFNAYLLYVVSWITPFHLGEPIFVRLVCTGIEQESEKRRRLLLEEAADTSAYLDGIIDYSDTIIKIEKAF